MIQHGRLILSLTKREIQQRYLASFGGLIWVLLIPLAQLAIYAFVFIKIFQARVPGADTVGYVPYLAVAFWAWNAFSESMIRASSSIVENRALIGKVAIPHEVLAISSALSSFFLNFIGQLIVLLVLTLTGIDFNWLLLPLFLLLWLHLLFFSIAFALFVSATQVYIRDLAHAMGPLLMLWFFSTPILYSLSLVPEQYRQWMKLNPFNYYVSRAREIMLFDGWTPQLEDLVALFATALLFVCCLWYFRRLSPRFEDYL